MFEARDVCNINVCTSFLFFSAGYAAELDKQVSLLLGEVNFVGRTVLKNVVGFSSHIILHFPARPLKYGVLHRGWADK